MERVSVTIEASMGGTVDSFLLMRHSKRHLSQMISKE